MSWRLPFSWGPHPRRAPAGLWRQPLFLTKGCWLPGPQVAGLQGWGLCGSSLRVRRPRSETHSTRCELRCLHTSAALLPGGPSVVGEHSPPTDVDANPGSTNFLAAWPGQLFGLS